MMGADLMLEELQQTIEEIPDGTFFSQKTF